MHSLPRLSRRARRIGTSTLFASFTAFSLLSGVVPTASAQSSPYVTIDDVAIAAEGGFAVFHVTVHGAHNQFTIDYQTLDGTAQAGKDYTSISNTVTLPADTLDSTVSLDAVPILEDNIFEADEVFHMKLLKSSSVYNIDKNVGDATIVSNDPYPTLTIKNARVTEGDPKLSTPDAVFDVTLSNPSSQDVTVDWATLDGSPVGPGLAVGAPDASSPGDYVTKSGTLTFPAETNPGKVITVHTLGDNLYEGNEKFYVQLSNASNANIVGDGKATGTIVENDLQPQLNISTSASGPEGSSVGPLSQIGVDVTLSNPSIYDVTFTYGTANGTARENDYATASNVQVTIPAGSTKKTLWFSPIADDRVEPNETFSVFVQSATNARIGNATCVVTIVNDD
jgi:hypothetical protein